MDGPPDGFAPQPIPEAYGELARPGLARRLKALGLAVTYHRALGDRVWWRDAQGREREAWDFLGGYGANLLGHHHPQLVATLQRSLREQQPFLAQASWRPATGGVAATLSDWLQRATGDRYVVTLASTGAEAVEAAWKAGVLKRHRRHQAFRSAWRQAAYGLRQDPEAWASLAPEAARLLPSLVWDDLEGFLKALEDHNRAALEAPPLALALDRAFHGKTGAATQFTHQAAYRLPFAGAGPEAWFLSFDDPEAWRQALQAAAKQAWLPERSAGAWRLVPRPLTRVALALLEPIQGEGGVHVLGQAVAAAVRLLAREHGFLFAYDEIQSGLGRSGEFLASGPLLAPAEAYLFGKALGGGMAKVSAFAWRQSEYDEDFGLLHTSTFAEDEPSSELALQSLWLIEGQDVPGRCKRLGVALREAITPLLSQHPEVFEGLRGRGLMLGLAFRPQGDNPSNAIRMLADQGLLGYAIAAHLLHEEGIRVAPTLSANLTLRLQPSAFLPEEAILQLAAGLDRVAAILKGGDVARLTRHVIGLAKPQDPTPPLDRRGEAVRREAPRCAKRVAFIGHFIQAEDAALWDPGLAAFGPEQLKRYQLAAHRVLGPTIYDQLHVQGAEGEEVHLSFVGLNLTSKSIEAAMRAREAAWIAKLVLEAALKAVDAGATMIGLGGYTSIVTDNGRSLLPHLPPGVGVTTGNAFTVAVGMQALRRGAEALGLPWADQRVAVVGAAGNIGQVHARLLGG
jgi:acetylornithine/succinyldiaminopimelate/putrescine aminotransferase